MYDLRKTVGYVGYYSSCLVFDGVGYTKGLYQ